ncbi:MAG TPA: hypothetical protein VG370_12270 [Chloroflexota bacterium]|nr:hypothetical protein [Chloroflexota bacterium]
MHRHEHFDLWLDDDETLAALLGKPVVERTTLHGWPLSCVQLVRLADGSRHVYKTHAEPTVEPDFYLRARAPLLVPARLIPHEGRLPALLLEHLDAPTLADLGLDEPAAVRAVEAVLAAIGRIEGELPAVADISTEASWLAFAAEVLEDARLLRGAGRLPGVGQAEEDAIRRAAESRAVLDAVVAEPGYVNTDLKAAHVFGLPDGHRVVDWQRPIRGPVALDRATLLRELGVDPRRHVSEGVLRLMDLHRLAWWASARRRPGSPRPHDAEIARLAGRLA